MKHAITFALILLGTALLPASAQDAALPLDKYELPANKLAVDGYDVVAYHTLGKAVLGKAAHTASSRGITYHFSSAANKEAFLKDPDGYRPAFGNWCAYAMSQGKRAEPSPKNFKVSDGRLFIFVKGVFANGRKGWEKDPKNLEVKANGEWKSFSGEAEIRRHK